MFYSRTTPEDFVRISESLPKEQVIIVKHHNYKTHIGRINIQNGNFVAVTENYDDILKSVEQTITFL